MQNIAAALAESELALKRGDRAAAAAKALGAAYAACWQLLWDVLEVA